jgi:hypothetical protein
MARVHGIRRHWSHSSRFVAALPRLFPAFIEAGEVPEQLYLEELQCRLKEQGIWLRFATSKARIAGLFASPAFEDLTDGGGHHLEATERPRQVCFSKL